ncbi:MAG: hypothetical protein QOI41_2717, partial [Myxococcales bacterium]|nr:hypothetical protein [Myxococcales bacterium]
ADEGVAASASVLSPRAPLPVSEIREARTQIEATLSQMRTRSLHVRDELRLTRKRGTKAQVVCVDEGLSRSDVALRRARELGDEILAAYTRGDGDSARAARGRLEELDEAQRLAGADAYRCTPKPIASSQLVLPNTTTVKVDIDPRIPRVD